MPAAQTATSWPRDERLAAGIDQRAGAMAATSHLLDLGHRRVAHVTGPLDWVEAQQRRDGWRAAHEERGLLPGPVSPRVRSARGSGQPA